MSRRHSVNPINGPRPERDWKKLPGDPSDLDYLNRVAAAKRKKQLRQRASDNSGEAVRNAEATTKAAARSLRTACAMIFWKVKERLEACPTPDPGVSQALTSLAKQLMRRGGISVEKTYRKEHGLEAIFRSSKADPESMMEGCRIIFGIIRDHVEGGCEVQYGDEVTTRKDFDILAGEFLHRGTSAPEPRERPSNFRCDWRSVPRLPGELELDWMNRAKDELWRQSQLEGSTS